MDIACCIERCRVGQTGLVTAGSLQTDRRLSCDISLIPPPRDGRFDPMLNQFGTKWDKYGIFSRSACSAFLTRGSNMYRQLMYKVSIVCSISSWCQSTNMVIVQLWPNQASLVPTRALFQQTQIWKQSDQIEKLLDFFSQFRITLGFVNQIVTQN